RSEKIAESKQLAVDMQNALSQRLQLVSAHEPNRGVKQAPFIVLTGANMPAVLSEIAFISNASDESLLLESGQRQRVAEGLYRGVAAYLDSLHSLPQKKQKLVSENGPGTSSGLATPTGAIGRTTLKNLQSLVAMGVPPLSRCPLAPQRIERSTGHSTRRPSLVGQSL